MEKFSEGIFAVAAAIVGVAIVAVVVSRNSQTANVISSAGNAFAQALQIAVSPVTIDHNQ